MPPIKLFYMKYKLQVELAGLPKTYNSLGRTHWAIKANEAKKWRKEVAFSVIAERPKEPLQKAKVTLIRFSSNCPDFDGLVSSFKPVIDGLKDGKILVDDKMSCIGSPTYKWEKAPPGKGKIRIVVESI